MKNFTYHNPVKIIFGKNTIKKLITQLPENANVLVVYGGGSIKKNGVYEQVAEALKGFEWKEFGGIEPNPHFETCMKAVEIIRQEKMNYILAVGGGSVVDAVKLIALAVYADDETSAWKILSEAKNPSQAVPFGVVLTLPATGSEMNAGSVITKAATQEKLAFHSDLVFPQFSILDPQTTYSLPTRQTANGIVDTFVHTTEQYLTYPANAPLQDQFAEGILKTLVTEGPKALEMPENYDVRANLMLAATWALNGWIGAGVPQDWATHMIGHELTAFHGLDHGQTLALVLPGTLTVMRDEKADKILQMGERVFGIMQGDKQTRIDETIKKTDDFFRSLGVKTRLSEYGLGAEIIDPIVKRMEQRGWKLGENQTITPAKVRAILENRL